MSEYVSKILLHSDQQVFIVYQWGFARGKPVGSFHFCWHLPTSPPYQAGHRSHFDGYSSQPSRLGMTTWPKPRNLWYRSKTSSWTKHEEHWHDCDMTIFFYHHMTMAQNDWPDWSPIPQMWRFSPKSNHIYHICGPFGTFCWASPPHIVRRRVSWYPSEHAGQPLFLLLLHSLTFFSQTFLTDPTLMIWKQTRRRPTSPPKPIPVLKWVMAITYFGNPTILNRIPLFKNLTVINAGFTIP